MLYAYDKTFICDADNEGNLSLSSIHEHIYVNPENDRREMQSAVIYEGKDIKAWAKKQNLAYPDAMLNFRPIFFGDNGKEYFIKK